MLCEAVAKRSTFRANAGDEMIVGWKPLNDTKSRPLPVLSTSLRTDAFTAGSLVEFPSASVSDASTHIEAPVTP